MNAAKALDTLTERVRKLGISEFSRRINRSKGTIHGVLAAKARTLTLEEAVTWMHVVGLHVIVGNDKHNDWSKTLTAAVRDAEQRASKKNRGAK